MVIALIYRSDRPLCKSHRGISFVSIVSKMLANMILRRLSSTRKRCTSENQAGFRPSRGCTNEIFIFPETLGYMRIFHIPMICLSWFERVVRPSRSYNSVALPLTTEGRDKKNHFGDSISVCKRPKSSLCLRRRFNQVHHRDGVRQGCCLSVFSFP